MPTPSPDPLHDLPAETRAFAQSARASLRARERLNAVESARLAAARQRALAAAETPAEWHWPRRWAARWIPHGAWALPALLATVAVTLAVLLAPPMADTRLHAALPVAPEPALPWLGDDPAAAPDFYRDLDFYQWLAARDDEPA